ncbi:MAG TPA: class I SAM-dependent methyltransferase [Candidatus Cryptobacteroides pullicola]|nr:class I SAM-dependent methyltransferase [Candidatus Cryptobacteroides pullicola]
MESSLNRYLLGHCSLPSEELRWIEKQTNIRTNYPQMLSGQVQGEFLKLLVGLSGARRIIEIGSFTGYSSTCMALGLPEDGVIDALEINDELEDLMREGWRRAGVEKRIRLHLGDAQQILPTLEGPYDMVFMDANKRQYLAYYGLCLPLLRPGGLLVADDTLWDGKVYADPLPTDAQTRGLAAFNDAVAEDRRVESVILPIRDGLTIVRKK